MKVALLSPICWRTPPRHYGAWEQVTSNIAEGLAARGIDVTLFATGDSYTAGKLEYVCERPYEEDRTLNPKVWECLHIGNMMEQAHRFDVIHNHYDFLPLTYSGLIEPPMVTTIHGFSSPRILPVYQKYNRIGHYVSISDADRSPKLDYIATVYNGIDPEGFTFQEKSGKYLLFFGRIHPDKGTGEAIRIARKAGMKIIISGIIQDQRYFDRQVKPRLNDRNVVFVGASGPSQRDRLMGGAYALLHPIGFEEPFGLSVAESMFCGTPVIAYNRGSMPELIVEGRTGFLVGGVDEAVAVLPKIKNIDRKYCRDWATQNFSQGRMVENYLRVYEKVLGAG